MRYNERNLEQFKEIFNKKFPNSDIEILYFSDDVNTQNSKQFVIVQGKYGKHKVFKSNLLKTGKVNCSSSLDKFEYFKNELSDKFKEYVNHYLVISEFKDIHVKRSNEWVIVQTKYGKCKVKKYHLLKKSIPTIQSALNKTEYFINQSKEKFNDKFNYDLVIYKNDISKVCLFCNNHKIHFKASPLNHLAKLGCCPNCNSENLSVINSKNPIGWNKTNWFKCANISKNFDSFKVYIIKCWNETEEFYKIGRTFLSVKQRFKSLKYYRYKIVKVYEFKEKTTKKQ